MLSALPLLFNKFSLCAGVMLGTLVLGWKVGSFASQQDTALVQDKLHRCEQAHTKDKHAWLEQQQRALQQWQQRYQHAVNKTHEADSRYQQQLRELNQRHAQLKHELNRAKDNDATCLLSSERVQHINAAWGLSGHYPTADVTAAATGIGTTPRTVNSVVTQQDLVMNVLTNGTQCQAYQAQINGLLDYIEGLHDDARN